MIRAGSKNSLNVNNIFGTNTTISGIIIINRLQYRFLFLTEIRDMNKQTRLEIYIENTFTKNQVLFIDEML
jgi:hypothetical protein